MTVFMLIIEVLAACLFVLLPCVIGISFGAVNLVCLYEKEVQQRVVELGLITEKKIKRNAMLFNHYPQLKPQSQRLDFLL